jgi:tetratricopeptide (TPR) repeat protein
MKLNVIKNCLVLAFVASTVITYAQTAEEVATAIKKEDFATAKNLCKQWMAKEPKSGDPYFFLGEIYYENEKTDSASAAYTQGLVLNEDSWLCMTGQIKLLTDKKRDAEATKLAEKVIRKTRNKNAYAFYQVARAYLEGTNPNPDKAIENLTRSLEIDSKVSAYYTLMGDAYLAKKESGKAVSNYEFASDRNKKDPDNYVKRARIWKSAKIWEEAEKALNTCLTIDPNYAPAIKELSEVYARSNQRAKVLPLLKRYNELVGNDYDSRMRYVRYLCSYADDSETALGEIAKLQQMKPADAESYRWLAWVYTKAGTKAKAEKADAAKVAESFKKGAENSQIFFDKKGDRKLYFSDFEDYLTSSVELKDYATAEKVMANFIAFDSTKTDFYDKIAKGYYDDRNFEKSAAVFETKIAKAKGGTQDYAYLGICYINLKNYAKADAAFAKAGELNEKYVYAFAQRAKIAELQDPELTTGGAKIHHEKVIAVASSDAAKNKKELFNAYKYLGYYNLKLGNDQTASLASFQKAAELDPTNTEVLENIAKFQGGATATPIAPITPKN